MSRFLAERLSVLSPYTPGEQPQDKKYIKLNTNESPFPPSPEVVGAITRAQTKNLRLYSDPDLKRLVSAIARQFVVGEDMVFCSNGSDEVLSFAFLAWGSRGVTFPDITYGFYPVFADLYGLSSSIVPLKEDFTVDINDYINCGKMVVIANPNAPTGLILSLDDIEKIVKSNPDNVVIIDEAYIDFGGESALPLIEDYKNLLIVRTFSKSRQLAGARLGFALGSPELIADLNRIKFSFNPYNVNRLTALAGERSVEDEEYFEHTRKKIIENRGFITAELEKLGFSVLDSKANFVFAKREGLSGEDYYLALKEKGILVRHFKTDRIKDFVRITVGKKDDMKRLVADTKEILEEKGL